MYLRGKMKKVPAGGPHSCRDNKPLYTKGAAADVLMRMKYKTRTESVL